MICRDWAEEEFGTAQLGNKLRTDRLIVITAALLERPHGTVLKAIESPAEREGSYRWLENPNIDMEEVDAARARACLKRMDATGGDVIIPIDQTSFSLPDRTGARDFGSVGNRFREVRGVQCLTALPLDSTGTPLGVLGQVFWARSETPGPARIRPNKKERDRRSPEEKESNYWTDMLSIVFQRLDRLQSSVRPWLQCDRGADFWAAFSLAEQYGYWITVRVYADRKIVLDDGKDSHLMPWMKALPKKATYKVVVPPRDGRPGRKAKLRLRWGHVHVSLGPTEHTRRLVPLYFVYALEEDPPPGAEPLSWKLATSFPVKRRADALRVVGNYKLRWRIEELHRTLKSGACNLETSQLESFSAFCRWAMIHTSVAARIERLKFLSRTQPEAPATIEYSREEIDTAIILRHKHTTKNKPPYQPGDTPTVSELTYWIASMGGYMGSRTKPMPGTVPLTRGLERLTIAVEALVTVGFFIREKPD
jgi:hypothetical protein